MDMIESLQGVFPNPQEVLAVREGIKPMLRIGVDKAYVEKVKSFCLENGLYCLITPYNVLYETSTRGSLYVFYISKSKEKPEQYYEMEREEEFNIIKASELLGYPRCCINFYVRTHNLYKNSGKVGIPFLTQTLKNSKQKLSFYLNNMFSFDSRVVEGKDIFSKIHPYFLISHIPCSYNCEESIEYAKRVLEILKGEVPEFAKQILHHIKRPVLFFDDLNWIVFDGEVKGNKIRYKDIIYHCLDSKELLEKLRLSNVVKVDEKNPETGVIFDFG